MISRYNIRSNSGLKNTEGTISPFNQCSRWPSPSWLDNTGRWSPPQTHGGSTQQWLTQPGAGGSMLWTNRCDWLQLAYINPSQKDVARCGFGDPLKMTKEFVEKGINDMSLKTHLIWFICKSTRCNSYVSVTSCVKLGWSTLEDCYWLGWHSQAYPRNHWWYCGWSEFCSISYCAFFISEASTWETNHKLQKNDEHVFKPYVARSHL